MKQAKEFFHAIRHHEEAKLRGLLAETPTLLSARNACNFGATPLNEAISARAPNVIAILLEAGADLDGESDWRAGPWPPLQLALSQGQVDIASQLAELGAKIGPHEAAGLGRADTLAGFSDDQLKNQRGGDGGLPLHFAANADVVTLLLDRGADPEAVDVDHESTAAQWTARHFPEATRALFAAGAVADPFSAALAGDLPTLRRILETRPEQLQQTISKRTLPTKGRKVMNILHYSVGTNCNALHAAAVGNQPAAIRFLLEQGLDATAIGGYDDACALHHAAWNNAPDAAAALLAGGAPVDQRSGKIHNNTALGWAIVSGAVETCSVLINHGAEILDFFLRDAEQGVAGELRSYSTAPTQAHEAIRDLLREAG